MLELEQPTVSVRDHPFRALASRCTKRVQMPRPRPDAAPVTTILQRLRPQLEKLPADEPEACQAANRRLEAFQPELLKSDLISSLNPLWPD
jgi:hypothetical protein